MNNFYVRRLKKKLYMVLIFALLALVHYVKWPGVWYLCLAVWAYFLCRVDLRYYFKSKPKNGDESLPGFTCDQCGKDHMGRDCVLVTGDHLGICRICATKRAVSQELSAKIRKSVNIVLEGAALRSGKDYPQSERPPAVD